MAQSATQEQVLEAARSLGTDSFTREDVAKKLGMEISEMQPSWKAAKEAGQLERVSGEGGKRSFKLPADSVRSPLRSPSSPPV
jgi:hypothetical protein